MQIVITHFYSYLHTTLDISFTCDTTKRLNYSRCQHLLLVELVRTTHEIGFLMMEDMLVFFKHVLRLKEISRATLLVKLSSYSLTRLLAWRHVGVKEERVDFALLITFVIADAVNDKGAQDLDSTSRLAEEVLEGCRDLILSSVTIA